MVRCRQVRSHYCSQYWPRSMPLLGHNELKKMWQNHSVPEHNDRWLNGTRVRSSCKISVILFDWDTYSMCDGNHVSMIESSYVIVRSIHPKDIIYFMARNNCSTSGHYRIQRRILACLRLRFSGYQWLCMHFWHNNVIQNGRPDLMTSRANCVYYLWFVFANTENFVIKYRDNIRVCYIVH